MGAETIGGHIVRSLQREIDSLLAAEKKGADGLNKAGAHTLDELDRLIALLGGNPNP